MVPLGLGYSVSPGRGYAWRSGTREPPRWGRPRSRDSDRRTGDSRNPGGSSRDRPARRKCFCSWNSDHPKLLVARSEPWRSHCPKNVDWSSATSDECCRPHLARPTVVLVSRRVALAVAAGSGRDLCSSQQELLQVKPSEIRAGCGLAPRGWFSLLVRVGLGASGGRTR